MDKGPAKPLVVAFACAVLVVGVFAPAALWQWGYTLTARLWLCLVALWAIELVVYPRLGRSGRMGCTGGVTVGLLVRAGMAAATAGWAHRPDAFTSAFVRYYGEFWLGAVLQVLMAAMLLWLLSDLVPSVGQLEEAKPPPSRRRGRGELLAELLAEARKGVAEGEAVPIAPAVAAGEQTPEPPQAEAAQAPPAATEEEAAQPVAVEMPDVTAAVSEAAISDQDTSELAPVSTETPKPEAAELLEGVPEEVVRAAVLDAAQRAAGVEDLRYLAWPHTPAVIANPPSEADEAATAAAVAAAAGAARALAEAGLLGAPELVALVFRSAGMLLAAATEAIVAVRYVGPQSLGGLVMQGRHVATELQAPWPEIPLTEDAQALRLTEASASCEALANRVAETGQSLGWYQIAAAEELAVVASGATDMPASARASVMLWRAASELGRQCVHATLRRLLICCERGAVTAGTIKRTDGPALYLVRIAPGVQPGMAAAELESLAALCESSTGDQ